MSTQRTGLNLNAFLMEAGHHEAAWRLPESNAHADFDLKHWTNLAKIAEAAKFDSLFLADGPVLFRSGAYRPPGQLEPITLLTALAGVTEHIGLIATASTTYNSPYNLARKFATLDHISAGRAGWNIVTSADSETAGNFGLAERPDHAARYDRATEFLEVVTKLWDSWEEEAHVGDKVGGRYADTERIHDINHVGKHFRVRGALNVERSPQGRPLLVQAGSSENGKNFAARHAEAIFTAHQTYESAAAFHRDIKARAAAAGRDPETVRVLPGIVPVIGATEVEAIALAKQLDDLRIPEFGLSQLSSILEVPASAFDLDGPLPAEVLARPVLEGARSRSDLVIDLATNENLTVRQVLSRLGGGRGHFVQVGTPEQIADTIIDWFENGAADGFNIMAPVLPSGLETFAATVIPILQERGYFHTEYEGETLRDHYGADRPVSQYAPDRELVTGGAARR